MKKGIIRAVITLIFLSACRSKSQPRGATISPEIEDTRMTFEFLDISLDSVLNYMRGKAEYDFRCGPHVMDKANRIIIYGSKQPPDKIMRQIIEQEKKLAFVQTGKMIFIDLKERHKTTHRASGK